MIKLTLGYAGDITTKKSLLLDEHLIPLIVAMLTKKFGAQCVKLIDPRTIAIVATIKETVDKCSHI